MSLTVKTKKWIENNAPVSLKGKTVVVTGANSGVGYKTAETMLYLGADVILACRNQQRAGAARETLAAGYPESKVSVMPLDLADFASIDAFVESLKGRDIDVFVNNAGALHQPGKKTRQGFDLVMGTNYIGTYYLTQKLLPSLQSLPHEVAYFNTISLLYKAGTVDFEDFYYTRNYHAMPVYNRSKMCLAKYTYHTARKLEGTNVRMYMCHPGISITPLGLNAVAPVISYLGNLFRWMFNSPEKSSLSVAYALSRSLPVGTIVGPRKGFGGWGYPEVNPICKEATRGAEELIAFTEREIRH